MASHLQRIWLSCGLIMIIKVFLLKLYLKGNFLTLFCIADFILASIILSLKSIVILDFFCNFNKILNYHKKIIII